MKVRTSFVDEAASLCLSTSMASTSYVGFLRNRLAGKAPRLAGNPDSRDYCCGLSEAGLGFMVSPRLPPTDFFHLNQT